MRTLKFRAWDKLDKRMMYRGVFDKNWYATERNDEKGCHCIKGIVTEDRHTLELMQFTGLKDKNGKEIYEGDIVNHLYHHEKAVIEWINCGLMMKYFDGLEDSMFAIDMEHIEVIGNIYENPALLNQSGKEI